MGSARRQIQEIVSELSYKTNTKYEQVMKFYLVQIGQIIGENIEALKQEFQILVEIGADDVLKISGDRQNLIAARKHIQMKLRLGHVEN